MDHDESIPGEIISESQPFLSVNEGNSEQYSQFGNFPEQHVGIEEVSEQQVQHIIEVGEAPGQHDQAENTSEQLVQSAINPMIPGWLEDEIQGVTESISKNAERAITVAGTLIFMLLMISLIKEHDIKMILISLGVLSFFWYLSRSQGPQGPGFSHPKVKKDRWLHVMLLRFILVLVVWPVSPASFQIKLYLTFIMLADPLTFGVYQAPRLQKSLMSVWKFLVEVNWRPSVIVLKILCWGFLIVYAMRAEGTYAGLQMMLCIVINYLLAGFTLLLYCNGTSTADCLAIYDEVRYNYDPQRPTAKYTSLRLIELQYPSPVTAEAPPNQNIESQPVPGANVEQALPSNENDESQNNGVDAQRSRYLKIKWSYSVAYAAIVALTLLALIRAFDSAQSNNLLWLSKAFPPHFYSIIVLSKFIIIVDYVSDFVFARRQHPDQAITYWTGFSWILITSIGCSIVLCSIAHNATSNELGVYLSIVAWFGSLLKEYLYDISQCHELLISTYILYMISYSIFWAVVVFRIPFFVALFII